MSSGLDVKQIFRALQSRNYRLFFTGQTVSLIGTWMQQVASGWLVYRLTNSPMLLGIVGFSGQIPNFVLSPLAGVMVDRWDKRRILLITQTLSMLQALVLAALVLTGTVTVWNIIPLSIFLGIVSAFDIPARQAFLIEIIDKKEDLANAIALNSSMFHAARLLGPSIAGLLIAVAGEGACFLLNGVSYIAVISALLALRLKPARPGGQKKHIFHGLKEGFVYAFGFTPIRSILLLLALMSLTGMSYAVLMPVFAKNILHGGPYTLGFLVGASGLGALTGAMYLASRKTVRGLGKVIALSAAAFGLGLAGLSLSRVLGLSLALMFVSGLGMMVQMASCNTVLQTLVDDDKRGRVMSLYTLAIMGVVPFGNLLAGALASAIGAPAALFLGGISCMAAAGAFALHLPAWREMVRPIYRKKGIIPEVATGMESAASLSVPPED